jgi:hypothetical protein
MEGTNAMITLHSNMEESDAMAMIELFADRVKSLH